VPAGEIDHAEARQTEPVDWRNLEPEKIPANPATAARV
jgi:hypothetical protein